MPALRARSCAREHSLRAEWMRGHRETYPRPPTEKKAPSGVSVILSSMPAVALVEPLTTSRSLRGPFDYLAPPGAAVGQLLRVPFGRRDVTGVVVGLSETSDVAPERLVGARDVLPQTVPADLVELARWMAHEYCS